MVDNSLETPKADKINNQEAASTELRELISVCHATRAESRLLVAKAKRACQAKRNTPWPDLPARVPQAPPSRR